MRPPDAHLLHHARGTLLAWDPPKKLSRDGGGEAGAAATPSALGSGQAAAECEYTRGDKLASRAGMCSHAWVAGQT